jgi:hypothetical protein
MVSTACMWCRTMCRTGDGQHSMHMVQDHVQDRVIAQHRSSYSRTMCRIGAHGQHSMHVTQDHLQDRCTCHAGSSAG